MPLIEDTTYRSPILLSNKHLATLIPNIFRAPRGVSYDRERIPTADGDRLDIDWSRVGGEKAVLLSHGLEGNSEKPYVLGMARHFNRLGWDVCAWNYRSCSEELNLSADFYHPAQLDDVETVLQHMMAQGNYRHLALIGFSMGGAYTLNYMARRKESMPKEVIGAVAFSTPVDLGETSRHLSEGPTAWYGKIFLRNYRKKMAQKEKEMPGTYDLGKWDQVKSLKDFDEHFNRQWYGFDNLEAFYRYVSPVHYLHQIDRPTLVVNAENDPFLTDACYPYQAAESNPYLFLEVPSKGGHIGFVSSSWRGIYWSESRAEAFLTDLL